jgi:hypothetical protein
MEVAADWARKENDRAMTSTQLLDLQRGFPPDISQSVHNGEPCRVMNGFVRI